MLRPIKVTPTVSWALYYPPVLDLRQKIPRTGRARPGPRMCAARLHHAAGNLEGALASLGDSGIQRIATYRTSVFLSAGRVAEARPAIARGLALDPGNATARALEAIVAVTLNEEAIQPPTK